MIKLHILVSQAILIFFLISGLSGIAQIPKEKPAYKLYDKNGKQVAYNKMIETLDKSQVVLFGEFHNNPIVHWLQLEVTLDLHQLRNGKLILGAEMFEADDQIVINEYLQNKILLRQLQDEAKLWKNFTTDIKPLLDFAKKNDLSFIATNIPRRYANIVSRNGIDALDSLDQKAYSWITPLPFPVDTTLPGYNQLLHMEMPGHRVADPMNFVNAQAIKDATMAHFILKNLAGNNLFIHFNGAYHSNNYEGIFWYLKKDQPALKIATISVQESEKAALEFTGEMKNLADFIIVVPNRMTKTH
jgi:uncharacterized iron-regulated protein